MIDGQQSPKTGRNTEAVVQESHAHFLVFGKQIVMGVISAVATDSNALCCDLLASTKVEMQDVQNPEMI